MALLIHSSLHTASNLASRTAQSPARLRKLLLGHAPTPHPTGYFSTKIFHPNVSASGEICVNVLKRDWKPDLGLRHVLTVIRCLLIEPNPESGALLYLRSLLRLPCRPCSCGRNFLPPCISPTGSHTSQPLPSRCSAERGGGQAAAGGL